MSNNTDPSSNSEGRSDSDNNKKVASDFVQQTENELAKTPSAWTEIDNVISYDAEVEAQTEKITLSQPNSNRESTQADEVINEASASKQVSHNSPKTIDSKQLYDSPISGVTNSAKFFDLLKIAINVILAIVACVAGWYIYQEYLR